MRKTLIAIANLMIGGGIAFPIIAVPWILLDVDKKVLWLVPLVLFGTAGVELTEIAGSIKTSRYQMLKRQITLRERSRYTARWNIFWWASGEYRDEFLDKLPRFLFRIVAWSLLAAAGLLLANISSACQMDMKDPGQPAAAMAVVATPW